MYGYHSMFGLKNQSHGSENVIIIVFFCFLLNDSNSCPVRLFVGLTPHEMGVS